MSRAWFRRPAQVRLARGRRLRLEGLEDRTAPSATNYAALLAANKPLGSPSTVVAILDDGIAYQHPDLDGNVWVNVNDPLGGGDNDNNGYVDDFYGWNFVDNNNDPQPVSTQTHGTLVAGV